MTSYTTIQSPVGELLLVGEQTTARRGPDVGVDDRPAQRAPVRAGWRLAPEAFAEVTRQLQAYFAGELTTFDLEPRSPRHPVPAADLAGAGLCPVRHDDHLRRAGRAARRPPGPDRGPRRRDRREPAADHPPLPPGHRRGRRRCAATPGEWSASSGSWSTKASCWRRPDERSGHRNEPAAELAAADWPAIAAELDASGCAATPRLLTPAQCRELAALYDQPELFRSTDRHGPAPVRLRPVPVLQPRPARTRSAPCARRSTRTCW